MGGWFEISTPILPLNRHATDTQLLIFGFKFSKGFFDSFLLLKFRCIHCISCCQFCCISCCCSFKCFVVVTIVVFVNVAVVLQVPPSQLCCDEE